MAEAVTAITGMSRVAGSARRQPSAARWPWPHRECESERRPLAHVTLDPDSAPVQLRELLGQGESEPRALLLPGVVPPDLAELLEEDRLVLGAIPISVSLTAVVKAPSAAVALRPTRPPSVVNFTAFGQEVHQDLLDLPLVRDDVGDP